MFRVIYVAVPDPPKVTEGEEWFAAPSNPFDETIAEGDLTFGLPPAPFAINANALVHFESVAVDVSELFKALASGELMGTRTIFRKVAIFLNS